MKPSLRALLLIGPVPPPSGGVASHVADLERAVLARGGRVTRLDTSAPGLARRIFPSLAAAAARGAIVHLHTNGHNAGSWRLIALTGALAPGRALLTLHSGLAPAYIAAHHLACRAAARLYRRVVCVSRAVADALAGTGFPTDLITMAPAFSAASLPLPLPPAGLVQIRARHRPLLSATLSPGAEYGADVLADGFARLAKMPGYEDAGLVVYGPSGRDPAFFALCERLGIAGRVHGYADLDRAGSLAVIAASDLFLRPTRADGDAVSVREALALGRRVVASDAALRPDGTITFRAGSGAALAEAAVGALLGDPPAAAPTDALAPVLAAYATAGVLPGYSDNHDNDIAAATAISHLAIASAAPAEVAAAGET